MGSFVLPNSDFFTNCRKHPTFKHGFSIKHLYRKRSTIRLCVRYSTLLKMESFLIWSSAESHQYTEVCSRSALVYALSVCQFSFNRVWCANTIKDRFLISRNEVCWKRTWHATDTGCSILSTQASLFNRVKADITTILVPLTSAMTGIHMRRSHTCYLHCVTQRSTRTVR